MDRPRATRTALWALLALAGAGVGPGCAHRAGSGNDSETARLARAQAAGTGRIDFENDFEEARNVYLALPSDAHERLALRGKLFSYLLEPLARLDAAALRREAPEVGGDDVAERIFQSFRDAVDLLEPAEVAPGLPALSRTERDLVRNAAHLVLGLFEPRGSDVEAATALAALASVEPASADWRSRLDDLLRWSDETARTAGETGGKRHSSAADVLQDVLEHWPSPALAETLAARLTARQAEFRRALAQPAGSGEKVRRAIGDVLLAHGDELQRYSRAMVSLWLKAGRLDRAATAATAAADQVGEDPDLCRLVEAAAARGASAQDLTALARRFLPRPNRLRSDYFHGTAPEEPDFAAATRVLDIATARFPSDADARILAGRIARYQRGAPLLALRHLDDARVLLEARGSSPELLEVSGEVLELHILHWGDRRLDPDRVQVEAASADAESLHRRVADARRRLAGQDLAVEEHRIDLRLAQGLVQWGLPDRAEPILLKAQTPSDPDPDIRIELANLAQKSGDAPRAARILEQALAGLPRSTEDGERFDMFEKRALIQGLLGDALEVAGDAQRAADARRKALAHYHTLLVFYFKNKRRDLAGPTLFEVGRLQYQLGNRSEGLGRIGEALEQEGASGSMYIALLAFLVQRGEVDQALAAYRRLLARDGPGLEYYKVYASLWIQDLTRRSAKTPDATAEAFLRSLDRRHGEIRPRREGSWYRQLARWAVGAAPYEDVVKAADTAGKRAELYFYEAMRRLADGKASEAHDLWRKVIETRMYSFFEYEMAARYLRAGAPSTPESDRAPPVETI